ncbi:hypothetical protein ACRB68_28430 [Actinomadura sp. RB68]|uniref:Fibronectin type-III domain-containing protein n=2 Tax=Actinomadura macrotermitis TaxID=2585200 RepID=A0A7K0BUF5_9ACTN|nr:hypothetical protein [Actinomadura macrotermitis]
MTLKYSCAFPLVPEQTMVAKFNVDFPRSIQVGVPTPKIRVDMLAAVNETTQAAFEQAGIEQLRGTARLEAMLSAPQGEVSFGVPLALEETPSGLKGTGFIPPVRLAEPGPAKFDLGDLVLNLANSVRTAPEVPLPEAFGKIRCTVLPGQNTSFTLPEIAPADPVPDPNPGGIHHGELSPPVNGAGVTTDTTATLTWQAMVDPELVGYLNGDLAGYEVYDAAGKVVASTDAKTTTATITGLSPDTGYTFTVRATGENDRKSTPLAITVHTQSSTSAPMDYRYTLKGSTFVKAPNGTAALDGTVEAKLKPLTGEFTADLALQPTKGDFKIFGFLPVQAGIVLVPEGETTGTLKSGTLTAHSRVTAKLPAFSLFGISIGGGENCRTAAPSDITLTSEPGGFEPLKGGRIKGTYDLSEIKDCGALTPLLSAFTKGAGNTIDLTLSPKS